MPSDAQLKPLVHRSFVKVDNDNDTFIEYYEFDTLIIVADADSKYIALRKYAYVIKCNI